MIIITTLIIALCITLMRYVQPKFKLGFLFIVLYLYNSIYKYYGDVVMFAIPTWDGMLNALGSALLLVLGWRIIIDLFIDLFDYMFDKFVDNLSEVEWQN